MLADDESPCAADRVTAHRCARTAAGDTSGAFVAPLSEGLLFPFEVGGRDTRETCLCFFICICRDFAAFSYRPSAACRSGQARCEECRVRPICVTLLMYKLSMI